MATIIKRELHQYPSGSELRDMAFDLADMSHQADAYIEKVRAEAEKIVQAARQEAEEVRSRAEEEGRRAAEAAVERILDEKVAKQMQSLTPALAAAVGQIEDSRQDWLRHWETAATHLACQIAGKIVRRQLESEPEIALQWVQEALQMCAGNSEIVVRLHPSDHETLGGQVAELAKVFHPAAPAHIVADASISRSGCLVETKLGSIDQQLETQLERLQEELS